jgi:ketosteroid isomerase-like protein
MHKEKVVSGPTSAEQNKAIVKDFMDVFSTGNVEGILNCLHEDATYWVSGTIEGMSDTYDKARLGGLLGGVTTVYKGGALQISPISMIAEGNKVAAEAESFAELLNGRVYKNQYHFLFEIADGKILRVKEYMDTQHAYNTFVA